MISFEEYSGFEPPPIDAMVAESESEGFAFLRRLVVDWKSGANRFDLRGETFFLAIENKNVIGVGGLNIDPYANDAQVGRLRHIYVSNSHRRRAIGRGLVTRLLEVAKVEFCEVRLRTDTVEGDRFYSSLGFTAFPEQNINSHYTKPKS